MSQTSRTSRSILSGTGLTTTVLLIGLVTLSRGFGGPYLALVVVIVLLAAHTRRDMPQKVHWVAVAVAATAVTLVGTPWWRGGPYHLAYVFLTALGVVLLTVLHLGRTRLAPNLVALAAVLAASLCVFAVLTRPPGFLDVALMHRAGADAVLTGTSPWNSLHVPSGAAGGGVTYLSGTPYPPAILALYTLAQAAFGDPTLAGAVGWLLTAAAVFLLRHKGRPEPLIGLVVLVPFALLYWTGWTELVTIGVVTAAIAAARGRMRLIRDVSLGFALASKQYMVLAAIPLVLGGRPRTVRRWLPVALASSVTAAGFLLGDGFIDSIIGVYSHLPPRSDSASLYGILFPLTGPFSYPAWVGPLVGSAWVAWRTKQIQTWNIAAWFSPTAEGLALLFFLGTQSFANYWALVLALVLMDMVLGDSDAELSEPSSC